MDGALCYRSFGPMKALAALLARDFTVYTYDRRGRGDSGDTPPYAIEREIEDLQALIQEAGGSACVYGISSGAALALEAASRLTGVEKLALYEAPFIVDGSHPPISGDFLPQLNGLLASGRRGAAVRLFMKLVGVPAVFVALMRFMPSWSKLTAVAHTLPYDIILTKDKQTGQALSAERWRSVTMPTLAVAGGKSPAWMRNAMQAVADVLPNARHRTLPGQTHMVSPKALAPLLGEFFVGQRTLEAQS